MFSLVEECCLLIGQPTWLETVDEIAKDRPILEMLGKVNLILDFSELAACNLFNPCDTRLGSLRAEFGLSLQTRRGMNEMDLVLIGDNIVF